VEPGNGKQETPGASAQFLHTKEDHKEAPHRKNSQAKVMRAAQQNLLPTFQALGFCFMFSALGHSVRKAEQKRARSNATQGQARCRRSRSNKFLIPRLLSKN
jgi:hypothetical protein